MCNPLAAKPAGGTQLVFSLVFILLCLPLYAGTSRRACMIDDTTSGEERHFAADCFYDDSGLLVYWIFSVRPRVVPECRTWDEKPGRRKFVPAVHEYAGGPVIMSAYESCEEIPETDPALLPPHATAITGFPAVWKTQREYPGRSYELDIMENWNKRQEEIEESWRNAVEQARSSGQQTVPKLRPNRTSPFLPVFHRPADNFRGIDYFLPQGAIERACQQAEAPGCDYVDPAVRQWKYQDCRNAGASCEFWLSTKDFTLEQVIQSQFSSWVMREAGEWGDDFPPRRVHLFPGELIFKTVRVPLYNASRSLVWYWNQFWQRCWEATPEGKTFDGCTAGLRDYVGESAYEKAEAKSYPNSGLKIEAVLIANAIDAARRFHDATRELVPLVDPNRWRTGVDGTHFEPDDLPPETVKRIRAAQQELAEALAVAEAALRNFAVGGSWTPDPEKDGTQ